MIDLHHIPGTKVILSGAKKNLKIDEDVTEEQLQNLLNILRTHCIDFEIHDPEFPSISDPGAYISYSQQKNNKPGYWSMTMGNHGWTLGIFSITETTILQQLKNLTQKKLLKEIQIETSCFFYHKEIQPEYQSTEMENRLLMIHKQKMKI